MIPRKFKLINASGREWNLMQRNAYFSDPEGLGLGFDTEYMRIGQIYEQIQSASAQKTVSGNMLFKTYTDYRAFADFISDDPLRLAYMPQNEWYYLDCSVTGMSKGEKDRNHWLTCPITFTATSMWYIPKRAERTSDDTKYPKKYIYSYAVQEDEQGVPTGVIGYTYADELNGVIRINNSSSEDSPCIISIAGPITSPTWYLTVNNEQVASGSVNAMIPDGHKLVVNSIDGQLEIAEYVADTNEFVRNLYQAQDWSMENFIAVPPGGSVITISGETAGSISAWVEVREVHETI